MLKDYLVFDIETSGLSHTKDRILEVGIVIVNDDKVVKGERKYVNANVVVEPNITKITGITQEDVNSGEPLSDVLDWFQNELADYKLIGHNVFRFDHPFLLNESKRIGHHLASSFKLSRLIDTAVMYKGWRLNMNPKNYKTYTQYASLVLGAKVKGLKYNVKTICEELEIDMEGLTQHNAVDDCILTSRIYQKMREVTFEVKTI